MLCKYCGKKLFKSGNCPSCSRKGDKNPFYGKKHSKESLILISKNPGRKGHKNTLEHIEKIRKANIGRKNTEEQINNIKKSLIGKMTKDRKLSISEKAKLRWSNPEYKIKMSLIRKKQMTQEVKEKILKKLNSRSITGLENKVLNIINKYNIPFKFVGDGKYIIHGLCPDFIDNSEKYIIEVYYEYFKERAYKSEELYKKKRYAIFRKYGYETMFINYKDLCKYSEKELADKINEFIK